MAAIRSFRDLETYKKARKATREVFELSKSFPREEKFSLTDQVRRSSRAVGAMVAEAWAKRRYRASFISKIDDALGEAMETQAWLDHALDCGYLSSVQYREMDAAWQSIGAMLYAMIERADAFCATSAA
jgi:four helix bundle protein